jgi:hypothetical protein
MMMNPFSYRPGWTLEEAQRLYRRLAPICHRSGYLLALCGLTLAEGQGQDLDLIAVPWRFNTSARECAEAICSGLGAETYGEPYYGSMGTSAYFIRLKDGRLLDIQFREEGPRLRQAAALRSTRAGD